MNLRAVRTFQLVLLATVFSAAAGWSIFAGHGVHAEAAAGAAHREPVLVELFTSESCSSCPPADALLARLDEGQFVPGAQAIVLSEHVTYWNQLGWQDPFSSEATTDRQRRYAERFNLNSVYTPQAVVDGAEEMTGSDSKALSRAIARAAARPKAALEIESIVIGSDAVHFSVRSDFDSRHSSQTELVAALAEDATRSSVAQGENAGRTLRHVAVVRVIEEMGAPDGRVLTLKLPRNSQPATISPAMRLVVFLADQRSGRVVAVAEKSFTPSSAAGDAP
jgi:hypothetical protein